MLIRLLVVCLALIGVSVAVYLSRRPRDGAYTATAVRDLSNLAESERKRTHIELPAHIDPQVVGDVPHHQAQWPQAHHPLSRANARVRGEG